MNSNFFDLKTYFIDEKVNIFKFKNCYKVFNDKGNEVGSVNQTLTSGEKALRLLLNKSMLPFLLEIKDVKGNILASISRGWTFYMSTIRIDDPKGNTIGTIKQKFKLLKPTFKIYNRSEELLAVITGDMKAWNFQINDSSDKQIGTISKKWNGPLKEVFTTADKYKVDLNTDFANDSNKIVILSSAITIDMVWRQSR
ncbi:scramblase [Polaribacter sp. Z014]|uniref:phospholipid scramblase family protein n=1 Tax=Polaribacter sp. Z014 TaxID=2927126 RepID=UPI002021A004|nr:phospholipid scramblase family protein [Polaribacter sp. Z014]MCL7762895.1 scramblase [Polaribacter sp. Z014]